MIVLTKKKILFYISCLSIFVLGIVFCNSITNKPKIVETVNLPVSNRVIILDAGHRQAR